MTLDRPSATPPGWYPNQHGQTQWWDGAQWGPLAPTTPAPMYSAPMVRPAKDATVAYLLLIFLGGLGLHRFYLRTPASGTAMLVFWLAGVMTSWLGIGLFILGGVLVWQIIDLFLVPGLTRTANTRPY